MAAPSYDEYREKHNPLPSALTGKSEKMAVVLFACPLFPEALVQYEQPNLDNAISTLYESLMEIYQDRDLAKATPDQLHYYLTENEGLVTCLSDAKGTLTRIISRSDFRLNLPSNQSRQIKNAFAELPEIVAWQRSLRASPTDMKVKDLLGVHLQAWRKA